MGLNELRLDDIKKIMKETRPMRRELIHSEAVRLPRSAFGQVRSAADLHPVVARVLQTVDAELSVKLHHNHGAERGLET